MSQIMKTFLGTFMIMLMAVTSSGILSGFLNVMEAQNMHSQIISELEDSNFNESVIKNCFDSAKEREKDLTITLYMADNTTRTMSDVAAVQGNLQALRARVELRFIYKIPFFGVEQEHILSGYAL